MESTKESANHDAVVAQQANRSVWTKGRDGARRWRQKTIFNRLNPVVEHTHNHQEFLVRKARFEELLGHLRMLQAQFTTLADKTLELGNALAMVGSNDAAIKQDGDRGLSRRLEAVQNATIVFRDNMDASAMLHLREKVQSMEALVKDNLKQREQLELDFHRACRHYHSAKQRNKILEMSLTKDEVGDTASISAHNPQMDAKRAALTVVTETLIVQFRNIEANREQTTAEELQEVQSGLRALFADLSSNATAEIQCHDATRCLL
ncbi:hypothetical protein ACHHYP_09357 [Achlya hypogyna]|uniref:Uncharacterized protein n=1 Tax=Achlya hypogyna TaxID=1202772 RepID=A0A1V9YNI5_ACHHY|nr:hypothetical protein ACHHYP_09357 [Achlya hypogyna]